MASLKISAHLKVAEAYAEESHARRLKVGCVIVKDNRPISVGYNGTPEGTSNECETRVNGELVTKQSVIHAEANSIAFAARNGVSTNNCVIVMTHSPCYDCAKLIISAGIKEVYYKTEYRITESLELLKESNIKVKKIGE